MDYKGFEEKVSKVNEQIQKYKEVINSEYLSNFETYIKQYKESIEENLKEGRMLRIGIVGEVKAGKSSFLNSLIFDGDQVLPKAATPMTAALTKINYSENPIAKIHYYTKDDWDGICRMAKSYDEEVQKAYDKYVETYKKDKKRNAGGGGILGGILTEEKSKKPMPKMKTKEEFEKANKSSFNKNYAGSKELVNMAQRVLDIQQYLGTTETVNLSGNKNEYFNILNEYVGADGKMTPLVKYTEISLENEALKDIEIVDTPGLNDPIISRGTITQDFLGKCDVVYLLSYTGQFITKDDMELINRSIPDEGINEVVVIGSKVDSGILDFNAKNATFKQAYYYSLENYKKQAKTNFEKSIANSKNSELLRELAQKEPMFVSAMMYNIAKKMKANESLDDAEANIIAQYKKRFSDFQYDNADFIKAFSSIDKVRNKTFKETKEKKDVIIQQNTENFIHSQKNKFSNLLEDINAQLYSNQRKLESEDRQSLKEELEFINQQMNSIRGKVKNVFAEAAADTKISMKDLKSDIEYEMRNYDELSVEQKTEIKHRSDTTGHLFWKKTYHWNETIHHTESTVTSVIRNLDKYRLQCEKLINERIKFSINIKSIEERIKQIIINIFDISDDKFDKEEILGPVTIALKSLQLEDISIDPKKFRESLDGKMTGIAENDVVKDENVPKLNRAQADVINDLKNEIISQIDLMTTRLANQLDANASGFIDNILSKLEKQNKMLSEQIENKDKYIVLYKECISVIAECKQTISE